MRGTQGPGPHPRDTWHGRGGDGRPTEGRRLRIGAQLSISKGLPTAARQAQEISAATFGFHTRNPRGGAARTIDAEELRQWAAVSAECGVGAPIGHLPYVVNLGSERDIWEFGVRVVAEDLVRCDAFGAYAIVLHPGHHAPGAMAAGIARVALGVRTALQQAGTRNCLLCLEGMAGQTGEIGSRPEELAAILAAVGAAPGLGVCLDTCHLFAAGWDLRSHAGIDDMLAQYDRHVGTGRLRVLHLNDSKFPLGSHKDRHERIGRGEIGREGMAAILTHAFLSTLPVVIETPVTDYREYAEQIATVRDLAGGG